MKPTIYYFDTKDGPRIVKADSLAIAKHHVIQTYIKDVRKATADDVANAAEKTGGLVLEDTTVLPGEFGAQS